MTNETQGHRSRQPDGTYVFCPGPATYRILMAPNGGGVREYYCARCGKEWSMA